MTLGTTVTKLALTALQRANMVENAPLSHTFDSQVSCFDWKDPGFIAWFLFLKPEFKVRKDYVSLNASLLYFILLLSSTKRRKETSLNIFHQIKFRRGVWSPHFQSTPDTHQRPFRENAPNCMHWPSSRPKQTHKYGKESVARCPGISLLQKIPETW